MHAATIKAITSFLPDAVLSNQALADLYPNWTADKILEKTGVRERRICAADQTAGDLAEAAAQRLFSAHAIAPDSIDFLMFCTQTPDYILPATACVLHARLGLRQDAGALDYGLGCSGYVYGLALAKGLIESGQATRVLLLTCDTYSKLIHPMDKSVRTLFGDAATATLMEAQASDTARIGPFVFGTDGTGVDDLIVPAGGFRQPRTAQTGDEVSDDSGNVRTADHLFMNGPGVLSFTLRQIPKAVEQLLALCDQPLDSFDAFVFHQANAFMLERLRRKLAIPADKFVVRMADFGNTVSSTIPIALEPLMDATTTKRIMLVGFGVGFSWAATSVTLGEQDGGQQDRGECDEENREPIFRPHPPLNS
jgi:3-oxoacyl-[acyl-carrier-protein] synthase-3